MRILATCDGRDLAIDPGVYEDPEDAATLGVLPGCDAEARFATSWDPLDDFEPSDYGWIGEDARGVWTKRHPNISLLDFPKLWAVVDEFSYGNQEIAAGEYWERSAYELEARITLAMALSRKHAKRNDGEN